mmetsp:Transcript_16041/g.64767  ORF Transcript_16041/g.64767 Transcript_16041/m.64767 type:complete len:465 (-) Transcript_16041:213-1607(-)
MVQSIIRVHSSPRSVRSGKGAAYVVIHGQIIRGSRSPPRADTVVRECQVEHTAASKKEECKGRTPRRCRGSRSCPSLIEGATRTRRAERMQRPRSIVVAVSLEPSSVVAEPGEAAAARAPGAAAPREPRVLVDVGRGGPAVRSAAEELFVGFGGRVEAHQVLSPLGERRGEEVGEEALDGAEHEDVADGRDGDAPDDDERHGRAEVFERAAQRPDVALVEGLAVERAREQREAEADVGSQQLGAVGVEGDAAARGHAEPLERDGEPRLLRDFGEQRRDGRATRLLGRRRSLDVERGDPRRQRRPPVGGGGVVLGRLPLEHQAGGGGGLLVLVVGRGGRSARRRRRRRRRRLGRRDGVRGGRRRRRPEAAEAEEAAQRVGFLARRVVDLALGVVEVVERAHEHRLEPPDELVFIESAQARLFGAHEDPRQELGGLLLQQSEFGLEDGGSRGIPGVAPQRRDLRIE